MSNKCKIHTARSLNKQDWNGYSIYVTRTQQRCLKYKADAWYADDANYENSLEEYRKHLIFQTGMCDSRQSAFASIYKKRYKIADEITLLCFCEDVNKCHRKILAEWLCETYPEYFMKGSIK